MHCIGEKAGYITFLLRMTNVSSCKIGLFGQFDDSIDRYLLGYQCVQRVSPDEVDMEAVVADLDGIVLRSPFKLNDACAQSAKRLKWIIRAGSGTDNISPLFAERGVRVVSTPVNAYSVAELVLALILGLMRRVRHGHESLAKGLWSKQFLVGRELRGSAIGIAGFGRIGREVAQLLRPFASTLYAYDRSPTTAEKTAVAAATDAQFVGFEALLGQADVIVSCLPGTPDTKHLFDARSFRKMRRGCVFVNVGRGSSVNIDDLNAALECKLLAGAALDVFDAEPPGCIPLFEREDVICTPHLGAQTREVHRAVASGVIRHLQEFLRP